MSERLNWEELKSGFKRFGFDSVDLDDIVIPRDVIDLVDWEFAQVNRIIPVAVDDDGIMIATSDPTNTRTTSSVSELLGKEVTVLLAEPKAASKALNRYYPVPS